MKDNTIACEMVFSRQTTAYDIYECSMCGAFRSVPKGSVIPECNHQ